MKPKKKDYTLPIIFGTFIYAFLIMFCLHYSAYSSLYPKENPLRLAESAVARICSPKIFTFVDSPKGAFETILVATIFFAVALIYAIASSQSNKHDRMDISSGSAKWETDIKKYNKQFRDPNDNTNMIISKNIRLNMDTHKTKRNNNMVIIGGSGSGKTRYVLKPCLCELPLNCSFVITDPSGEIIQSMGKMLDDAGYKIKCFNLVNMSNSNHYNPFEYVRTEDDILILVDTLLKNTTDPQKKGGDDFWEKAQQMMLCAFVGALWKYGDILEFNGKIGLPKNLLSVTELMRACSIDEKDSTQENATDEMFNKLAKRLKEKGIDTENEFCIKQYNSFKMGAGRTLKSILISALARLSAFDIAGVRKLVGDDDIHLEKVGDEKTALFIILPTANSTYAFLSSLMYSQLFQILYYHAENECLGNFVVYNELKEVVKIFPIPHFKEEKVNDNENAEEIELGETTLITKHKSRSKKKNKLDKTTSGQGEDKDLDQNDEKVVAKEQEQAMNALKSANPEMANAKEEGIKKAKADANDFIVKAKNAKAYAKGTKYIVKVGDEIIHWFGSADLAKKYANTLKNCYVKTLGLRLPYHVRFLLDEFANIGEIPNFNEKLSTMRKYELSCTIILQALSQIKKMYEKDWGVLLGNCDSLLFLGCPEFETQEYISKKLGVATIKARDYSVSKGGKGGRSFSYKYQKRELMTPDEVGLLDNSECIYFLRGNHPFREIKYPYELHPNYKLTGDADSSNMYEFIPERNSSYINTKAKELSEEEIAEMSESIKQESNMPEMGKKDKLGNDAIKNEKVSDTSGNVTVPETGALFSDRKRTSSSINLSSRPNNKDLANRYTNESSSSLSLVSASEIHSQSLSDILESITNNVDINDVLSNTDFNEDIFVDDESDNYGAHDFENNQYESSKPDTSTT